MASRLLHTVKPSGGDFTSLKDAIDHLAASHADLVAADVYADVEIDGTWSSGDTGNVIVDGITTDSTHYINIYTTASARHAGVYSTSKYYLTSADGYAYLFWNKKDYVRLTGIQIVAGSDSQRMLTDRLNYGQVYDKILLKGLGGSSEYHYGVLLASASNTTGAIMKNSIAYNLPKAFRADDYGYTRFYNCTAIDSTLGFECLNQQRAIAKNCLSFGCTTSFSTASYWDTTNSGNNASDDDATGDMPGSNCQIGVASGDFVDYANDNFHLAAGASVIGDGADLTSDVTDDIDGDTRSDWDIGADEYAATTSIKTIGGLAVASVKTAQGLAIASVKTVQGLA